MLLKNHLIEVFKQASSENNFLLKENIVLKWVHRFGIDSLNDLLIHSSLQKENQHEEENQEQISLIDEVHEEDQEKIPLIDEVHEEKKQEQIRLESFKTLDNLEETNCESNYLKTSTNNQVFSTKKDFNQKNQYIKTPTLPLPNIKNLRKWINKDKKAS